MGVEPEGHFCNGEDHKHPHPIDTGDKCYCEECYDEQKVKDKAMDIAKESLKIIPTALLFAALKALGWLFIGIAALKFTGVI